MLNAIGSFYHRVNLSQIFFAKFLVPVLNFLSKFPNSINLELFKKQHLEVQEFLHFYISLKRECIYYEKLTAIWKFSNLLIPNPIFYKVSKFHQLTFLNFQIFKHFFLSKKSNFSLNCNNSLKLTRLYVINWKITSLHLAITFHFFLILDFCH